MLVSARVSMIGIRGGFGPCVPGETPQSPFSVGGEGPDPDPDFFLLRADSEEKGFKLMQNLPLILEAAAERR